MSKPLILMYHRIADEPIDYWRLAVSPAHFEEQLSVLRRTRRPLSLAEFVVRLAAGTLPSDAVAVTFDDGYVDNLAAGLPRLLAADIPATVFLATGFLDSGEPFWWDELASFILGENGTKRFSIEVGGTAIEFDLGAEQAAFPDSASPARASMSRSAAMEAVYQPLRRLDQEERRRVMAKLRSMFSRPEPSAKLPRPMTSNEVRMLAAAGLVTIGSHSVTHPRLPELLPGTRRYEINASKLACEMLVGAPIEAFSYPFGEFDADTCEAVEDAGFHFACSTGRAPAISASDVFSLRRVFVTDLDGDGFERLVRSA